MLFIGRLTTIKMSLLQLFCIVNTIPVNIPAEILKLLGNKYKGPRLAKTVQKKGKLGGCPRPDFRN